MRYAMIMAGGAGTRLWPMSRAGQPKQLIRFIHEGERQVSLLEVAARRLEGLVDPAQRYICAGEAYRSEIERILPEYAGDRLLGEPAARDTVNAVGFAAAVFGLHDPDAVFGVLTADHLITPPDVFNSAFELGYRLVEADPTRLVTFGIRPTYPATGFGYIEQGPPLDGTDGQAFRVARFVEKPALHTAQAYLESGDFHWNAGMFVFHARTFMRLLEKFCGENHAGLAKVAEAWDSPRRAEILEAVYPTLPKTSVDYGIMEPASNDGGVSIVGVKMDVDWLDVGSWPSYGQTLAADADGNRVAGVELATHDSRDNLVIGSSKAHTVALVGCQDLIVVHTPEATLVVPRERAQDLKALHAELPDELR